MRHAFLRRVLAAALSLALAAALVLGPAPLALAKTYNIYAEPDALQLKVEETAAVYNEAFSKFADIEARKREKERDIAVLEGVIPDQRQRAQTSVAEIYRMQASGNMLLNLLLSSTSFEAFVANLEYAARIQGSIYEDIDALERMLAELEAAQKELATSYAAATVEKERAEAALVAAQEAREEAQRRAEELRKKQEAEAKRAAAEAAKKAAQAAKEAGKSSGDNTGKPPPSLSKVDWSSDKVTFVDEWASKINSYLSGSPLAGFGEVFASAAWDNGVDPRWSPAISHVESSKGRKCFRDHNAWGWGDVDWPDWTTAINAHVNGLARVYGYTVTVDAAKKYCPPSWESWYTKTVTEMGKI